MYHKYGTVICIIYFQKIVIVSQSFGDFYNIPESHMPYYYRQFPNELQKCYQDEKCPYQNLISSELPCWGYEDGCSRSSFSTLECEKDHKGWVKTKEEQIQTFYNQGDFGYIRQQRDSVMVMCEPSFKDDSILECNKYLQFCRGRNLLMNFTSLIKRTEPFRYKMDVLSDGNFGGYCHLHKKRLMDEADHLSPLQSWAPEMRFFTEFKKRPIIDNMCDIVLEKPTFVMKIDADVYIIIWETYPYYSAFSEMWKAFTVNPIFTLKNFVGRTVCFKNVVFPLLPRMIFGLYYNTPLIYGCEKSGLFRAFSEFILHRLKIPMEPRNTHHIRVTLLSRKTAYRNILNEEELVTALKENTNFLVRRTVFNADLNFRKQLEIIRSTDILIGMHGAGLTHLLFLPDWAGVFELYNCEDENCYLDLARLRGVKYVTWKDKTKLKQQDDGHHPNGGAHAKFTNYAFDVKEFLRLVGELADHVQQHLSSIQYPKTKHNEL